MGPWNIRWRVVALLGIIALFNAVQCTGLCAAGLCGAEKPVSPASCHGDSSPDEKPLEVSCTHADLAIGKRHADSIEHTAVMPPVALQEFSIGPPTVFAASAAPVFAPVFPPLLTVLRI
jgi:hypothetical protein